MLGSLFLPPGRLSFAAPPAAGRSDRQKQPWCFLSLPAGKSADHSSKAKDSQCTTSANASYPFIFNELLEP